MTNGNNLPTQNKNIQHKRAKRLTHEVNTRMTTDCSFLISRGVAAFSLSTDWFVKFVPLPDRPKLNYCII